MQEIEIQPVARDRLRGLLSDERNARFDEVAGQARLLLGNRVVWNVNATAQGGGVAEMLQTLLAYVRGVDVDTRWLVLSAEPAFFAVTKRIHNMLHGEPGDGGALGDAEHALIAAALAGNLAEMLPRVRRGDVVVLHDPQTAGLVDGLRAVGAHVVWRCHVGRDESNVLTDRAWAFLQPLIENADAFVFSRRSYAPEWIPDQRLRVITPSIDPFSAKNCPLTDAEVQGTLLQAGLLQRGPGTLPPGQLGFVRRGGSPGSVRPHRHLFLDGAPLPLEARLVVQVSRWDRLKDMAGVLTGFADRMQALPGDAHLVLVGPEVSGVSDDPEGAEVLAGCRELWHRLDPAQQERIHLVCLPMDDVDENAHLVNALQRRASVIVQKSLVEGFGLTVTEAMWKGRPVVASAIGGIRDQIVDGEHGLLLEDPDDLGALGDALETLLVDPDLCARLGSAAHERVQEDFLGDRQLEAYAELFSTLLP